LFGGRGYPFPMPEPPMDAFATEAELARCIAWAAPGGATEAESALYRRYAPRARLYGLRHLRDAQAASDFMQQVMLMTLEQLRQGKLRDPEKLGSFIFGLCRMLMLELRRGGARRERLLEQYQNQSNLPLVDTIEWTQLDKAHLMRCLERLSERERSVLVMTFYDEKSAQQVATALGITPENVRVVRHRGLAHLRECVMGSEAAS
jgi:RNA polymerase sigma-70 factor (ECF subfamily)